MTRKLTRAQFIATYDNSPCSRFCFCIPLNIGSVEDVAGCNVITFSVHFALTLASFVLVVGYVMDYYAQVILATSLFTIAFTSGIIVGMSIYLTNCSYQRVAMQTWLLATFLISYIQFMTLAFIIGSILNEFGRPSRSEEDIESFVGLNGGHVIFYLVYIPVSIFTWILAIYSLMAVYFYLSVDIEESMMFSEQKPDPDQTQTSTNGSDEPEPMTSANQRKAQTDAVAKERSGTKSAITNSDQIQTSTNGSDANESLTTKDREPMKKADASAKERSGTKSDHSANTETQTVTSDKDSLSDHPVSTKEEVKPKESPLIHEDQKHEAPTRSERKQPETTKEDEEIELQPLDEREKKAIDDAIKKYIMGKQ